MTLVRRNSYDAGLRLTAFREGDHQVPVYFRLTSEQRLSTSGLQEAYVDGDHGKIPLASLPDFQRSFEPSRIDRRDRNRLIEVSTKMEPDVTGKDIVQRVLDALSGRVPPVPDRSRHAATAANLCDHGNHGGRSLAACTQRRPTLGGTCLVHDHPIGLDKGVDPCGRASGVRNPDGDTRSAPCPRPRNPVRFLESTQSRASPIRTARNCCFRSPWKRSTSADALFPMAGYDVAEQHPEQR